MFTSSFLATSVIFCTLLDWTWGFDWCTVVCDDGDKHTLCDFPEDGGNECDEWQHGLSAEEKEMILDLHNRLRQKIANGEEERGRGERLPKASNMMQLVWDKDIEETAQRWVSQCKYKGHDRCRITKNREEVGQNYAHSGKTGVCDKRMEVLKSQVMAWYNEVEVFENSDVGAFGRSSREMVGHFTALIWASTTHVGCGVAHFQVGTNVQYLTKLVCNYREGGNVGGWPIYKNGNDKGPASNCPKNSKPSSVYNGLCQAKDNGDRMKTTTHGPKKIPDVPPAVEPKTQVIRQEYKISIPMQGDQFTSEGQVDPELLEKLMKQNPFDSSTFKTAGGETTMNIIKFPSQGVGANQMFQQQDQITGQPTGEPTTKIFRQSYSIPGPVQGPQITSEGPPQLVKLIEQKPTADMPLQNRRDGLPNNVAKFKSQGVGDNPMYQLQDQVTQQMSSLQIPNVLKQQTVQQQGVPNEFKQQMPQSPGPQLNIQTGQQQLQQSPQQATDVQAPFSDNSPLRLSRQQSAPAPTIVKQSMFSRLPFFNLFHISG